MPKLNASPTNALLRECGVRPTLDDWLAFNGVADEMHAELLEVIPEEFIAEYTQRFQHNSEMNRRFERQQLAQSDLERDRR